MASSVVEVFTTFLRLGLTSFGGPVAHLGYFRRELIERRGWLDDAHYAQLLAICQFLPGPASSQAGFALGLIRAGWAGALAAFVAFTLPSVLLLLGFAVLLPQFSGGLGAAFIHGLKLVAVAVVAQAVWAMARQLCPDRVRGTLAVLAAVAVLIVGGPWIPLAVVLVSAVAGWALCRGLPSLVAVDLRLGYGPRLGLVLIFVFLLLLVGLPWLAGAGLPGLFEAFYRAGALVFGGGHVVLPLLEQSVVEPGWVSRESFLAGYGAAQAVPGPMFSLAAYLGALASPASNGLVGALVALLGIFLPGFLLLAGVLPLWQALAAKPAAVRVVAGVNAGVVGLLGAALYDPVWTGAVGGSIDAAIALLGFMALSLWRVSPLWVVAGSVAISLSLSVLGY